jgi:hypothetical protein
LADEKISLCIRTMEIILGEAGDVQQLLTDALDMDNKITVPAAIGGVAGFARII